MPSVRSGVKVYNSTFHVCVTISIRNKIHIFVVTKIL